MDPPSKAPVDPLALDVVGLIQAAGVIHAEVRVGDSVIKQGSASPEWPALSAMIHLYLPDVDAVFRRALEAGATAIREPGIEMSQGASPGESKVPLLRKLNLKDQGEVLILAPPNLSLPNALTTELQALEGGRVGRRLDPGVELEFAVVFVRSQAELDAQAPAVCSQARGDAVLWFAYPKKSSKRYTSDIHRDAGWEAVGARGFEGVRQVAIDEDWSAVRFRRVNYINTFSRDPNEDLSEEGRARAAKGRSTDGPSQEGGG